MGTKTIRQLEERMAGMEPGSLRHETLEAARRFKSSWIELGQRLWTVWKEKALREKLKPLAAGMDPQVQEWLTTESVAAARAWLRRHEGHGVG